MLIDFPITDPHIHQWDPYTTPRMVSPLVKLFGRWPRAIELVAQVAFPKAARDFVGKTTYVADRYLPARYAAESSRYDIDSVVHVQAGWHDDSPLGPVGETSWLMTLPFESQGIRLAAIVAEASPEQPGFAELLDAHRQASEQVRGIRAMAAWHPDSGVHGFWEQPGRYCDPGFLEGFAALAERGMTFDAWCFSGQLPELRRLANEYPDVPIVLDHCGTPAGLFGAIGQETGHTVAARETIFRDWQNEICRLAEHDNVRVKLSGLLMPVLGHGYDQRAVLPEPTEVAEQIAPVVSHVLEAFGAERCMFASNFPMDRVSATLDTIIEAHALVCEQVVPGSLPAIFRDNARQFYRY